MGSDQKRAILAVILSGAILFGWQYFFAPAPNFTTNTTSSIDNDSTSINNTEVSINTSVQISDTKSTINENEIFSLVSDKNTYKISSNLSVLDAGSSSTNVEFSKMFKASPSTHIVFNFNGKYESVYFAFNQINESSFTIKSDKGLDGKIFIDDKGFLNVTLTSSIPFTFKFVNNEKVEELEGGKTKLFVYHTGSFSKVTVGDDQKGDKEISWFGTDVNYHLLATIIDKQPLLYKTTEEGSFELRNTKELNAFNYKHIFAKKEYDHLVSLGNSLVDSVDFGIWSIVAVPILRGLQFFYSLIPNYGISIIILTILIRLLTFPLQYKSFKSMKKMQDIQPELTRIREKYKSDPQKMQQETMGLFKKAGANPLGGCFPLLLQMPIFFAFYQVLYSSVELVDAPFYFWIYDLSEKDPYYVLPILMAAAMFFHQKLTPMATMDATQKKIMLFMPLIFAVFMKDFPAGLTLYIFVSTVIAMLQQIFVFKRT
jgi:YidC/Oxa1 family membrane protein insertase